MISALRFGGLGVLAAAALGLSAGVFGCSSSSSSGSPAASSAATCSQICTPSVAAHCPNDAPDCMGLCTQEQASVPAACQPQNQALITCAVHASYDCDSTGESTPIGCDSQISAYGACLAANPSTATGGADGGAAAGSDAGGPGNPGTGTTPGACQLPGNSCGDCVATSCCTETQACGANAHCSLLSTCLTRCISTDQACTSACSNLYPDATSLYNNSTNCVSQSCTYACTQPPAGCTYVADPSGDGCPSSEFPIPWSCPSGPPQEPVPCNTAPDGTPNVYCCLE
jgi:hypothetical protein